MMKRNIGHSYVPYIERFIDKWKGFFNDLFNPWKTAKNEKKGDPSYIDQPWFIKGFRYCWEQSVLNRNLNKMDLRNKQKTYMPLLLFILNILVLYILYIHPEKLYILFASFVMAYFQFSANNLITLRNENILNSFGKLIPWTIIKQGNFHNQEITYVAKITNKPLIEELFDDYKNITKRR